MIFTGKYRKWTIAALIALVTPVTIWLLALGIVLDWPHKNVWEIGRAAGLSFALGYLGIQLMEERKS